MKSRRGSREPSPKIKRWNRCRANSCFSSTTARRPAFAMSAPIFDSRREARNSLSSSTARATRPSSRRRPRRSTPRLALARAFIELRAGRAFELRRMRALVDAMGAEPLLRASGLTSEPYSSTCRQGALSDLLGARQVGENFFAGFAAPFGRFLAQDFADLADAVSEEGAKELRLTPWRAILAPTQSLEQAARIAEAARALGFIVDAGDARLAIAACPGAPECSQAQGADAHWPRRHRRRRESAFPRRNRRCMCRAAPRAAPSLRRRR